MKKHLIPNMCADPEKQFLLLLEHIHMIRSKVQWIKSHITIYVEHNLGFEVSVGHSYGFEVMGVGHTLAPGVTSIVCNETPGIQEDVCAESVYLGDGSFCPARTDASVCHICQNTIPLCAHLLAQANHALCLANLRLGDACG